MSYKCDRCNRSQFLFSRPTRRVIATAPITHPKRHRMVGGEPREVIDEGGSGTRIVKEQNLCPACVAA